MTGPTRVLYLEGDVPASKYVRNVLGGHDFELVEGTDAIRASPRVDVVILSDLPITKLGAANEEWLVEQVQGGVGLIVVGGWSSYGRGLYDGSRIAEHFPVRVEAGDDRVNLHAGAILLPGEEHPLTQGFDFDPPPMIAGFNRVRARRGAKVILEARRIESLNGNGLQLAKTGDPALVASEMSSRCVAIATDLAPHWSGGWTDWGTEMVRFADGTEIGDQYVSLLRRVVAWTARREIVETPTLASTWGL